MRLIKFLVVTVQGGVVEDACILDTQAQVDAFQDDWARDRGFADWEEYQDIGHATDGLCWYTLTVAAALIAPGATVTLA